MATEMDSFYTASTSTHVAARSSPIMDELFSKYSSSMSNNTCSRPKSYGQHRNIVQRCIDRVRMSYYRYEVTWGVYVMTPGEKFAANTFVLIFLSLLVWALFLYFPQLLFRKLARFVWLVTGHSEDVASIFGIFRQSDIGQGGVAIPTSSMAS